MLEFKKGRLYIGGKSLPKGDMNILKQLLKKEKATAFELMEMLGKIYVQYVQYRLRVLVSLGLVGSPERGVYEINPEIRGELENILKEEFK